MTDASTGAPTGAPTGAVTGAATGAAGAAAAGSRHGAVQRTLKGGLTMGRLAAVVLWLCVGHVALGGVYWMLLNVPESNAIMLIGSALLALLLAAGAGAIDTTALLRLRPEWPWRRALARSLRVLPAFLLAMAVWVLVHAIVRRLARFHGLHSGELDAWLIATFDWTRTAWLHRAIDYVLWFVEWVIGTSLAVSLLSACATAATATTSAVSATSATSAVSATSAIAEVFRFRWIVRGLAWRPLAIVTVALCALVFLPWQAVYWRPASLPATSVQVTFTIAKLLALGLVMHVGWALVLWSPRTADRRATPAAASPVAPASTSPPPPVPPAPPPSPSDPVPPAPSSS